MSSPKFKTPSPPLFICSLIAILSEPLLTATEGIAFRDKAVDGAHYFTVLGSSQSNTAIWTNTRTGDVIYVLSDRGETMGKRVHVAREMGLRHGGDQHATLLLRKLRGEDNVILTIEKGQFLCGYGGCDVSVRLDDKPARRFSATGADDHSTTKLFINNEKSFIAKAKKAKQIRIQAVVYQNGSPVFEFETAGLKWK